MRHQRILTLQKLMQRHHSPAQDVTRTVAATAASPSQHFSTNNQTTTPTTDNNNSNSIRFRGSFYTGISPRHYSTWRKTPTLQNMSILSCHSKLSPSFIVPNRQYPATVLDGERRNVIMPDKTLRSPVPDIDLNNTTFHQYIFKKCDEFGDLPALSDFLTGRTYTFNQVKDKSIRLASALSRRGYKKGDIILVFSPNQIDYTILMLACSSIGAWFCAANPSFTQEDLARQISISDSVAIFTHQALASVSDEALVNKDFAHKIKGKFVFGEAEGYEPFQKLLEDDGEAFPKVSIDPVNDVLALPYSSGTTGLPKGVMLSHQNVATNLLQILKSFSYKKGENVLGLLPLYHIYGMVVIQAGTLGCGAHLHLLPKFDPESFLACLQDRKIETANLVPPLVLFLAKHPVVTKFDLSAMKNVVVGAAPLGKELSQGLKDRFGQVDLLQGFGLTETSPVTHIDIDCIQGSIGSLVCNTTAKLVNLETGELCGANEEGELCVKGPQVMLGYYKNEEATREMVKEDGWLHTGDIGYYNENGTFYIADRMKELIKYKGSQVAPAELEALLQGHPDVADACVVGKPDEAAGELPKAFVVKKPGANATEEDIIKYIDGKVSHLKRLRGGVEFIQEIPKNPSGKILRRLLRNV